jgi:hypothetical protein
MSGALNAQIITLAQAQSWLQLDGTESEDVVDAAVQAATDAVIDWLQWDPRLLGRVEQLDGTCGYELPVNYAPITAVSAINLINPAPCPPCPMDMTTVSWDPVRPLIFSSCGFPGGIANVQVYYTAGYAQLPSPITQGVLYTISAMIAGSGVDFNATGEAFAGVIAQNWQPGGPATVPLAAQTLLRRYRIKWMV